jgi:hypothetical protein
MDSLKFVIVVSIVLLATDLIYHQDVKGSPDTEKAVNEATNKVLNELTNEANELIAAANSSNITGADTSEFNDELNDNSGVGYYDPPYSYTQCLTVFTKEMCDFRFNSD